MKSVLACDTYSCQLVLVMLCMGDSTADGADGIDGAMFSEFSAAAVPCESTPQHP